VTQKPWVKTDFAWLFRWYPCYYLLTGCLHIHTLSMNGKYTKRTSMVLCVRVRARACMYVCVCARARACVRVCVRACVSSCGCVGVYECVHACVCVCVKC
jgi:hypothetical protein